MAQFSISSQTFNENGGTALVMVTLSRASSEVVTIPFTISGTATIGSDFTAPLASVVFPPGSTSQTVSVTITDDAIADPNETIILSLVNPINGILGSLSLHVLTILDDDTPFISSLTIPVDGQYFEGDALDFIFHFSQTVNVVDTPQLHFSIGGTAVNATFLSGSGSNNLVFRYIVSNSDLANGPVLTSPLDLAGGSIRNALNIDALLDFDLPDTTGVIIDGRSLIVSFATSSTVIPEVSGTARQFTLNLSSAALFDYTLPYKFLGNASANLDYHAALSSIVIPAGQTSVTIPFDVLDDSNDETSESFALLIDRPTTKNNLLLGSAYGSEIFILDDDPKKHDDWILFSHVSSHSCGITSFNILKCWGENSYGQIGDGSTMAKSSPVIIDPGVNYKFISNGFYHTCGITTANILKCWGRNSDGQIGDGSTIGKLSPTIIDPGVDYLFIKAGSDHTCGITTSNVLKCWGSNFLSKSGYFGAGVTAPRIIDAGVSYSFISISDSSSCGITTAKVLKCWGSNTFGQLGNGTNNGQTTPVIIDPGVNYKLVSNGYGHTCAITESDVLKCWGYNLSGQLGNGNTTDQNTPVIIDVGITYQDISAKGSSTCGITTLGSIKCWGSLRSNLTPEIFDDGVNYQLLSLSIGYAYPCAITNGAFLKCFNSQYQNSTASSITPMLIPATANLKDLSIHIGGCIIETDNHLKCWGSNNYGEIGDGTHFSRGTPVIIDPGTTYKTIAKSSYSTCGITSSDTLKCWGKNDFGQLGDGTLNHRSKPVVIDPGTSYKAVSVSDYHGCGITNSNAIKCWGANFNGQLGNGTTTSSSIPIIIDPGVSFLAISNRNFHTCGITLTGVLKCWGRNSSGQLGDGTTTNKLVPTVINSGVGYKEISANSSNTCGITSSDQLKCWGYNFSGQVGDGTTTNRSSPVVINAGVSYKQVAIGSDHTCAITNSDTLQCWGRNSYGQVGDGTTSDRTTPQPIDSTVAYKRLGIGNYNSCGITSDDQIKCWGNKLFGLGSSFFQPYGSY